MNCQEVQELVEEAIDNRLSEPCKRKVARHLARCARCQALFAAEKSEHAALFRALNDVSDIPPPRLPQSAFAARLAASVPSLAKRAGHAAVPIWLKRAAALAVLCGGAALAAWIGGRWAADDAAASLAGPPPETPSPEPMPEGTEEMKPKKIAQAASAAIAILATPPAQGSSSAEAAFGPFSSAFRSSAEAGADAFLSRSRTLADANALSSFNSFEPKGLYILFH